MEKHYQKMIKDTQNRVIKSLQIQILDKNSPRYGGFADDAGIVHAKYAIYRVAPMIAVYCNPDTVFYKNELVYERLMLGLDYVKRVQHENGLFDYVTCNFNSAPDTAFCVKKLLPVYQYLLKKEELTLQESAIEEKVGSIVKAGALGMLEGGFHTPNHRWAIASVLMMCAKIFNNEQMRQGAMQYLNEGIDCNEDGEFAEKSAGNYNRINNDAMIMLAEATGDETYDLYAIKNLQMMLSYWEPDASIFTANSTRFDKDLLIFPKDYYMEYLKMGMKYRIPEFLQMCNRIFDIVEEKGITSPDFLIWFMLNPECRSFEWEGSYQERDYKVFYRESGIARSRCGRYTMTVMRGKSNFFYIHNGTIKMEMKLAGSFCEHRAFVSQNMERISEGEYHLSQVMKGWYYLPFKETPSTSDWWKMDNKARDMKMGPDVQIDVWVKEAEHGVDIRVKTSGVEGAPWRIELAFSGVNFLHNEYIDMPLNGGEVIVVKQGYAEMTNGVDTLIVGPCFGEHYLTEGKEDSEARNAGATTLYLTAYTGFDKTIEIRDKLSFYEKR